MAKISVVVNTYNASQHLQRVIDSVRAFDEVLVCDMESTDDTLDIARRNGCRIVTFPKDGWTIVEPARQFAIEAAENPWVLVVDADELVSEELRAYLYEVAERADAPSCLWIPRKNYFMGRFMHCTYPDYIPRFLRKADTHWPPVIHAAPEVNGRQERIPRSREELAFTHLANDTIRQRLAKTNEYTDNEVAKKQGKNYGVGALLWRPFWRFFKAYIMKGGFRDGTPGFIWAVNEAIYQFAIVSKIIEKRRSACGTA
ncbi:MAG: glycosyltransferase family 2 protein [Bacteroidaceae bacterium]|nr:glycosyltransferase family 2 protein [Bacteroidaceae bacterium]